MEQRILSSDSQEFIGDEEYGRPYARIRRRAASVCAVAFRPNSSALENTTLPLVSTRWAVRVENAPDCSGTSLFFAVTIS